MKINGKEVIGAGIIETALDGLTAREFCLCVTYKKERKSGKGFDIRRTTLPEIVRRNNDIALAIPEFVAENMCEGVALETCAKFCEKYGVEMLPIERKRLEDLRAIAAAKKAEAANNENGEKGGDGTTAKKEKKVPKTAAERITDIIGKIKDVSKEYKLNQLLPAIESIDPAVAEQVAEVFRRAYIPGHAKEETAKTAAKK